MTSQRRPDERSIPEIRSSVRETVDMLVSVVVTVYILMTFVAATFVIPTGSMATTLYGDQRRLVCGGCGYAHPVNASNQPGIDPPANARTSDCPNCGFRNDLR